jgi:3-hydroxyisobutyrate dehydrogenase-like beta-hydroxyacid dehydrogenase
VSALEWGVIGFGQAGSAFASHIATHLHTTVSVTDPVLNVDPRPRHIQERMTGVSIDVVPDIEGLLRQCDIVLSLVTAAVAEVVTSEVSRAQWTGTYIDCNSISPKEKQLLARLLPPGCYVDAAVLGNVTGPQVSAQLALSGPRADEAAAHLTTAGFRVSVAGHDVGDASAVKMCRSIFMKGVECLFLETMLAADAFGVGDAVLATIDETFSSLGLRGTAEMLITTHATHCGRRSDEMRQVVSMLEELGLPRDLSRASVDILSRSRDSGLAGHVHGEVPEQSQDVIAYLTRMYRGGTQR